MIDPQSLDASGGDENGGMRGGDGEEVGCTKENDRCAVRVKVHSVNADRPEEGWEKDHWTRPMMS